NPDGDTLTETWHITFIQDNTAQPKFFGTGVTTAISGDAAFLAAFGPVGTVDAFDWIEMPLSCTPAANCTTLDQLATTRASATAPPRRDDVLLPRLHEPAAFDLLGSVLVAEGCLALRRRERHTDAAQFGVRVVPQAAGLFVGRRRDALFNQAPPSL